MDRPNRSTAQSDRSPFNDPTVPALKRRSSNAISHMCSVVRDGLSGICSPYERRTLHAAVLSFQPECHLRVSRSRVKDLFDFYRGLRPRLLFRFCQRTSRRSSLSSPWCERYASQIDCNKIHERAPRNDATRSFLRRCGSAHQCVSVRAFLMAIPPIFRRDSSSTGSIEMLRSLSLFH